MVGSVVGTACASRSTANRTFAAGLAAVGLGPFVLSPTNRRRGANRQEAMASQGGGGLLRGRGGFWTRGDDGVTSVALRQPAGEEEVEAELQGGGDGGMKKGTMRQPAGKQEANGRKGIQ